MSPLEAYLTDLRTRRDVATKETSGYPAFETLLNAVGSKLKPKVHCVIHPAGTGEGLPDAGLFTDDQLDRRTKALKEGAKPSVAVVEIKGLEADLDKIESSKQVAKYLLASGQVLISNYREFRLLVADETAHYRRAEVLSLAKTAADFWELARHPRAAADAHEARLTEFLTRCLRSRATITDPKDVAWFLASHARDALDQLAQNDRHALDALASVRKSFEQALGLTFTGEEGDHFFRSSLVQTLFYGIFSAWVLWARDPNRKAKDRFDWQKAAWTLRVPMISALFEQIATPNQLGKLHLRNILENTGDLLNRVDRTAFFQKFQEAEAVQYFYEPFLEEFDPSLRKELGVWYTPREVVKYMVARVDTVLREDLGIKRGLADEQVVVLDPCCGTGAFLLEVLDRIGRTLKEEGGDALTASDLRKAATERLFGFELLPAPFVVSHLQMGLRLQHLGAPLKDGDRAGVYLTNALTGWLKDETAHLPFPELEQERELAEEVKQQKKVLVILGNPPYNGYAGVAQGEEADLVTPYKDGLQSKWGIKKFNLDDLYVRFFRVAERKIIEGTGRGIVCFISNFSYIEDMSFVVMREHLLNGFERVWIDCLNGDSRETGKLTPDGHPDPSVFSTTSNSQGIRVGTAVGTFVHGEGLSRTIAFRDFWGKNKRSELLASIEAPTAFPYAEATPIAENRFSLVPGVADPCWSRWVPLPELFRTPPLNGVMEKRGGALIDIDRAALEGRMRRYFDPDVSWEALLAEAHPLTESASGFEPRTVRKKAIGAGPYAPKAIQYLLVRPFDIRWCYYTTLSSLWNRARADLGVLVEAGTSFLATRPARVTSPEGFLMFATSVLGDNDALRGHAYYFARDSLANTVGMGDSGLRPNISNGADAYLSHVGSIAFDGLLAHTMAITSSSAYLTEHESGLQSSWPRIPLPRKREHLLASADLGSVVSRLFDPFRDVSQLLGVHTKVGVLRSTGGSIDPSRGGLELSANWGNLTKAGIVMPGEGRITDRGATVDIHLNDRAYWANVPKPVWEYTLGGYQVIKKWLSYREKEILGRDLTVEEARYVTEMIQRIAAILALGPELDKNYEACKKETYSWKG